MTKLEIFRRNAKLTIAQLSEISGVSAPTIIKIEAGRIENVTVKSLRRLADALGCEAGDFLMP